MNTKKRFLITSLIIFLVSAFLITVSVSVNSSLPSSEIPEPDLTAHQIMDETINTLSKKYNINPCGIGMNGKFEYLEISFQVRHSFDKDELRDMLFDCADEFLKNINSNEKIRPHLKNYPFEYKNAGIVFFISDERGSDLFHPNICVAKTTSYGVAFLTDDPDIKYKYKERFQETHEEAIKLVNEYRAKKNSDK